MTDDLKVESWKDLVDILGVFRPAHTTDSLPSVSLTIDSKGMVKAEVKVFSKDAYDAMRTAEDIFDQLRVRYSF